MKKLTILFIGLLLFSTASFSQVDDRAVIPVAVTLNSILRLNVVSGGNIEFNFNTLADYTNGKFNTEAYNTVITVASSVDWDIDIYAEDDELIGTDNESGINSMRLSNIGYSLGYEGSGAITDYNVPSREVDDFVMAITQGGDILVGKGGDSNAGDVTKNHFVIHWRCGTKEGTMWNESILQQSIPPDRYATNVFLVLRAHAATP
jgi:hypothetical protein